jgi:hypothetical protein
VLACHCKLWWAEWHPQAASILHFSKSSTLSAWRVDYTCFLLFTLVVTFLLVVCSTTLSVLRLYSLVVTSIMKNGMG